LFGALAGMALGEPKSAVVLKTLTPEIDSNAKHEVKMWGPFKLSPSNVSCELQESTIGLQIFCQATHSAPGLREGIKLDPNSDAINGMIAPPCKDCTVIKAVANLAYKDGRQADVGTGVYTHHIIITQVSCCNT
jgi:hypothetical protein